MTQFEDVCPTQQPSSKPIKCRKNLFLFFGSGLILLVCFMVGISFSNTCLEAFEGSIQHIQHSRDPADYGTRSETRFPRAVDANVMLDMNAALGVATRTRPNKYFGPTISPENAAKRKAARLRISASKRDSSDMVKAIQQRANLDKRAVWQPSPGLNWTYQLSQTPTSSQLAKPGQYNVWGLDLFDTPTSSIQTIQAAGSKVICYFSGGTFEDWRTDSWKFTAIDKGNAMGDWPGETWLNTNSANVRRIMAARLDLAKSKGCNAVDPDNIDAYNHDTGFTLTETDAISYVTFLSQAASKRGLAISLKNSGEIIPSVVKLVQFSIEEACAAYTECDVYKPFTDSGKAVFHVEYPKGYGVVNTKNVSTSTMNSICACRAKWNLSPIVKNNNLDTWQQPCS